jgi:pilus assembly protein CpaF
LSLKDRLNKTQQGSLSNNLNIQSEFIYNVAQTSEEFNQIKGKLHGLLIDKVNTTPAWSKYTDEEQKEFIKKFIENQFNTTFISTPLSKSEKEKLAREVIQETKGFGPLDPLLLDPSISDILVNGPKNVYVERNGKIIKTSVSFKDNEHLMNIIERIVSKVGRRIDEKSPMVDARLPDGSRVNAIIPPLALDGASLSIRRFKADIANIDSLLKWGAMSQQMAETLKAAVKGRLNIIISGGTGAGKTTLLNGLSGMIPEDERIVTIEDSAELALQQDHVVRLETRPANIEGQGAITARDLVINALRMRPDRVVIGECRGAETLDMLQAMNTGHDGSLTTLHSNAPRDALSRMQTMVMFSGIEIPEKTIKQQISSAVNLIVQVSRLSDGTRRITYITEVIGMEGDIITLQDIFKWEQTGLDENNKVIGTHKSTGIRPKFLDRCKAKGIKLDSHLFNADTEPVYLCVDPPNKKIPQIKQTPTINQNPTTNTSNNASSALFNRLKK